MRINGNALRDLRVHRGLSMNQLAVRAGVSRSLVSAIENGTVKGSPSSAAKLAQALSQPNGSVAVDDLWQVELQASMCMWWVFAVDKNYSDRQGADWQVTVEAGPSRDDQFTFTLGDVPERIVQGIRDYSATRNYMLNRILRGDHAGLTISERDELLDEQWQKEDMDDIYEKKQFGLWASFELSRPVVVLAHPTAKFFWTRSETFGQVDADGFASAAKDYISAAVTRIQAAIEPLQLAKTLVRTGPYLVAESKAALAKPRFEGRGFGRVSTTGWRDLDVSQVSEALRTLPVGGSQMRALLRTASRWLWAALAEDEDRLRRFLFAFFGLEVLVNKTWSRVKTAVISELSADLGGFPVEELMWPTGRDESYTPERNLTFKFTLLAVALSRPTAPEDVATFKTLAAARNKLAHGAAESIELLPSNETISLLRRYLSLVAKADVDRSL